MPILYFKGWYSEELCDQHPDVIFAFGDNTRRIGRGGQAIIRSCPNILGIATKRIGDMAPGSFFVEGNEKDRASVEADLASLRQTLEEGKSVVIPLDRKTGRVSFGLERAELPQRAPSLYALICTTIEALAIEFGSEYFAPRRSQ